MVSKDILTNWKWRAGLVVSLSVVLGILAGRYTEYQILDVVLGVNAIAGLISVVYQLSNSGEQPPDKEIQQELEPENDEANTETQKEKQQEQRIGPSKGLTAEEQAVQNEMIRRDYRDFYENPVVNFVHRQPA